MDKPTRFEVVLLFLNVTSHKFTKDIPTLFGPEPDYYYRRGNFFFSILIVFASLDALTNYLHWDTMVLLIVSGICFVLLALMSYVYEEKIRTISAHYYDYYNSYLYVLYIVLVIAGFAFLFNGLIGVDPKGYK
jgi:hypothetical protein